MIISLDRLPPGRYALVVKQKTSKTVIGCYQEIGLIPGCRIYCRYRSPGGKVTVLNIGDETIAFRSRELRNIKVFII